MAGIQIIRKIQLTLNYRGRLMVDVSIIIPAKNEEAFIGQCLESVLNNSYPGDGYEILVVDNGSTDDTREISRKMGAIVYEKPDLSISALRNFGAKMAKGRILAFLDADCTVAEDWLCRAEEYFKKDEIVCFGAPPGIPDNPTWVQKTWFLVRGAHERKVTSWLETANMLIKREAFLAVGGFNEHLTTCEDVDISYRLLKSGKIVSDPSIKTIHHREPGTLRDFFNKERWRGRSNYNGLLHHGLKLQELPSLLLPIYFGLIPFLVLIFTLVSGSPNYLPFLIVWQIPIVAGTLLKTRRQACHITTLMLFVLLNVYYAARLSSMLQVK